MNILISHFRSDIVSGAERAISDMVCSGKTKFQYTMLIPEEGELTKFYRNLGVEVWVKKISTPRKKYPGLHYIQSVRMGKELKKRGYSAVLCNTFAAASRISTSCKIGKIPYVIFIREYVRDTPLHRKLLRRADALMAVSSDLATYINKFVPEKNVIIVYDNILFEPISTRIELHKKKQERIISYSDTNPVIGWVGRITGFKQPEIFIRSIPLVLKQIPNARFILIGKAQNKEKYLEENLKQLIVELKCEDKITMLGERTDVIELMSEMSVFCMTSNREPLGRVLLEAQLVGCSTIAPNSGGAPEVITDYLNGLLFDSTNQNSHIELSEKIVKLLGDQELKRSLIENGKNIVKERFASIVPVQNFENVFTDMIL